MWGSLLTGVGAGLVKGDLDKDKQKKDAKLQSEIARYSPWTGMQASAPQQADMAGSALQGGMAGASFGQSWDQAEAQDAFQNKQLDLQKQQLELLKTRQAGGAPVSGGYLPNGTMTA